MFFFKLFAPGNKPGYYHVDCAVCNYSEMVEILPADLKDVPQTATNIVTHLPEKCPECGGKVKCKKLKTPLF